MGNMAADSPCSNSNSDYSASTNKRKRVRDDSGRGGTKHPVYRRVRMRTWGKWVSEIRELPKKSWIWLDTFATPEMAARAHDIAALTIKEPAVAILNFLDLIASLPRPASNCPCDVQAAAVKAAAMSFGNAATSSSSSSSSLFSYSSAAKVSSTRSSSSSTIYDDGESAEELYEIIELPRLGSKTSYLEESRAAAGAESVDEFVWYGNSWLYDQTSSFVVSAFAKTQKPDHTHPTKNRFIPCILHLSFSVSPVGRGLLWRRLVDWCGSGRGK